MSVLPAILALRNQMTAVLPMVALPLLLLLACVDTGRRLVAATLVAVG